MPHYPDCSLCIFYYTRLTKRSKARLPGNGPLGNFTTFVVWVLVNNRSAFTVCPAEEDITSHTPDLEPSQLPPTPCTEPVPEPLQTRSLSLPLCQRQRLHLSQSLPRSPKFHELAASFVQVVVLVEYKGIEGSLAHTPVAEGELYLASGNYEEAEEDIPLSLPFPLVLPSSKSSVSPLVPSSSKSPGSPMVPPSLPLLPPLPDSSSASPLLVPISSSAPPPFATRMHLEFSSLQICHGTWIHCLHLGSPSPSLHLGSATSWLDPGSCSSPLPWPPGPSMSPGLICPSALPGSPPPSAPSPSVIPLVLPVMSLPWLLPSLIPSPPCSSCFCLLPGSFHYFRHSNFSHCHLLLCPAL